MSAFGGLVDKKPSKNSVQTITEAIVPQAFITMNTTYGCCSMIPKTTRTLHALVSTTLQCLALRWAVAARFVGGFLCRPVLLLFVIQMTRMIVLKNKQSENLNGGALLSI